MKTRHFFTIVLLVGVSLLTLLVPGEGKPSVALAARASVPAPRAMDYSRRDAAADSNVVYVCSSSDIGRTNDISAQSPHWTDITPPVVGTLHDCVPDPWKPQEKMWAVSSSGIWKGENLNTATSLWTHLQTTDQIRYRWPHREWK